MPRRTLVALLLVLSWASGILWISYGLERHETGVMLSAYFLVFAAYLGLYLLQKSGRELSWLLAAAVLLRLALLPLQPNLSDDVYRFVWDGRLLVQGADPFAYTPDEMMDRGMDGELQGIDRDLYQNLNSPGYFTIYPPVHQLVFALSAWLGSELWQSILIIRLVLILGELLTFRLFLRLFEYQRIPRKRLLLYALNPLVVIELSGNLHFEGLMIAFLLLSYSWLLKNKRTMAALGFALAVCTKLLPLMLLPLYLRRLWLRPAIYFYLLVGLGVVLMFTPLLSEALVSGLGSSIGLYFQKFEFNASIYYVVREIGYEMKGYNTIATSGKRLALAAFGGILLFSLLERKKRLPTAWMWVWLIYLLFATTVHPWYIIPLFAFSLFTQFGFPLLWTALVFLSYSGYYEGGFEEKLSLTALEYLLVLGMLLLELWKGPAGSWRFIRK